MDGINFIPIWRFDLPQQLHLHVRFPGHWLQMEKVQKLSNQVKERLLR